MSWTRGPTIGHGATATVSLAAAATATPVTSSSSSAPSIFAVKSMDLSISSPLQREKDILSSLHSPHIVSYLGFDITSDASGSRSFFNLFMEYAPGGSLSDEIKRNGGKLDELSIRSRSREILLGLADLHDNRVVHCDIKSENIVIGVEGTAKIADLGCAKELGDDPDRRIRGTPAFMAPEVARGEAQGPEADVWAFGCTVIEMATGRSPWLIGSEIDPFAVLHRIAFSGETPAAPAWFSDEGKDFVSKCLMKCPNDRWSAKELLKHSFLASLKTSPEPTKWVSPKSILDLDVWESLADDDDEYDESPAESQVRFGDLFNGEFSPNWSWDENWIAVRNESISIESNHSLTSSLETVNCDLDVISGEISEGDNEYLLTCVNYDLDLIKDGVYSEVHFVLLCKIIIIIIIVIIKRNNVNLDIVKEGFWWVWITPSVTPISHRPILGSIITAYAFIYLFIYFFLLYYWHAACHII
ncbi:Mitogen-activated protein kinase kinase kinase protein [Dioscorea alata]|uniref:Mitogen-activated protein kinase kinase kinase protein n=1 Tax=Dioscorea alata TaxID=55571 RepID=A0ACB7UDS1_DIOAL|nr:Mitogen-activated protein kinase kinase kinase protein [Dioscorea alata]